MSKKKLYTSETVELSITKDERYELIAQIAQRLNEFKTSHNSDENQLWWDNSDTELNFDKVVSNYN